MFVEKLSFKQIQNIIEKVVPKSLYSVEVSLIPNKNPAIELNISDRSLGNYSMYLFDTYLYSSILFNEIAKKNKILIKELYNIFGEEYKKYYLNQVNEIFE